MPRVVDCSLLPPLPLAQEDRDGAPAEPAVDRGFAERREPLPPLLPAAFVFDVVAEEDLHEAPQRIGAEPAGEDEDEDAAEPAARNVAQRPLAIGRLAALTGGELDREHADEPERHSLGDEAEAREALDPGVVGELLGVGGHGCVVRIRS